MNAIVHNRNLLKDSIIVEEKAEAEQYKKASRLKENKIRMNAVRAKYVSELRARRAVEVAEVDEAPGDGVLVDEAPGDGVLVMTVVDKYYYVTVTNSAY